MYDRSDGRVCRNIVPRGGIPAEEGGSSEALCRQRGGGAGAERIAVSGWRGILARSTLLRGAVEDRVVKWIVDLFKKASEKLGSLWGALARAKDVLSDCRGYITECVWLCGDARSRGGELGDLSAEIREHLLNIVTFDRDAIASIKILLDGDEIRRAIRLATTMDDIAVKCVRHVLETIWKVCGAIRSMPELIVEGIVIYCIILLCHDLSNVIR